MCNLQVAACMRVPNKGTLQCRLHLHASAHCYKTAGQRCHRESLLFDLLYAADQSAAL
jgi:hypothetical protein